MKAIYAEKFEPNINHFDNTEKERKKETINLNQNNSLSFHRINTRRM